MKISDNFYNKLFALQKEFPMCFISAWTPEDYKVGWKSKEAIAISDKLGRSFDANLGINWDTIQSVKDEVCADKQTEGWVNVIRNS